MAASNCSEQKALIDSFETYLSSLRAQLASARETNVQLAAENDALRQQNADLKEQLEKLQPKEEVLTPVVSPDQAWLAEDTEAVLSTEAYNNFLDLLNAAKRTGRCERTCQLAEPAELRRAIRLFGITPFDREHPQNSCATICSQGLAPPSGSRPPTGPLPPAPLVSLSFLPPPPPAAAPLPVSLTPLSGAGGSAAAARVALASVAKRLRPEEEPSPVPAGAAASPAVDGEAAKRLRQSSVEQKLIDRILAEQPFKRAEFAKPSGLDEAQRNLLAIARNEMLDRFEEMKLSPSLREDYVAARKRYIDEREKMVTKFGPRNSALFSAVSIPDDDLLVKTWTE